MYIIYVFIASTDTFTVSAMRSDIDALFQRTLSER